MGRRHPPVVIDETLEEEHVDTILYLMSKAVPDLYGVFLTVPAILFYIKGREKKRFCSSRSRSRRWVAGSGDSPGSTCGNSS